MVENPGSPQLRKGVGLLGVVTFGAGTAIGVSIFSVLQPAAQVAGSGLLVAIGVAMLPMLLFAISYAYLGSAVPVSGASYEWPSRFLHPSIGFLIAWLRIIANVGALTILSQVLVGYLNMVVPLPLKLTMALLMTLLFGLNYIGVSVAARVQTLLMGGLMVVLAVFVALGLPAIETKLIGDPLGYPPFTILAAVPLLITLFLGIESAVEIGEEVRDPGRNIPLGIACAILLTAIVYSLVAVTALGLVGPARLAASSAPLLDAARVPLGALATPLIVGAACFSIVKSMNAAALVFSRSLFAMARNDVLPRALAAIHPRFGTPHRAVLFGYGLAMTGLLLPPSLIFLLLAVNVPTMLKYMACSLSAARVATHHPELHQRSHIRLGVRGIAIISYAGAAVALAIAALGIEADWRPYLLVGGWLALGIVYWLVRGRHARAPDAA
ncbi:MAG TPA: APC family permease [Sphingobium sp.]|uniref:APC family permease n=1 Tax=Sphingobium sp. TaxID=1912891 RepID=UPI002ECFED30